MTPDEARLLRDFLDRLRDVRAERKDPEAAAEIADVVRQQPDAPYLLVQRAILLEQAVAAAEQRIAALENELRGRGASGDGSGGFLDPNAWGRRPASGAGRPAATSVAGTPLPPPGQYAQGPAAMPAQPVRMGGGSFLPTAAAVAAGAIGGAFLSHGLANLFGHGVTPPQRDALASTGNPDDALFDSRAPEERWSSSNDATTVDTTDVPLLDDTDADYTDQADVDFGGDDSDIV